MSVEYVEKLYNRYSGVYDLLFGKVFANGRERAPNLLDLIAGAKLLEVGVGTGLSIPLLPRNIEITGVDVSQKMLNRARRRIDHLDGQHVQLLKMDANHLQFPDNTFDRVLAAYFISTVEHPVKAILEMKRVCRRGGYLVFLNHFRYETPVVGELEKYLSPFFYRLGFRTDLDVHVLMEQTGLKIETLERIDSLGHWKAVRCVNPD